MAGKPSNQNEVVIYGTGDVLLCNTPDLKYKAQFTYILDTLREADIRYCQLEQVFSDRLIPTRIVRPQFSAPPKFVDGLKYAGFDVISPNGNHTLDFGADAMLDTIDLLQNSGIKTIGVGKDIDEATRPAIIEKKGNKIAFLSYNSTIPNGAAGEMWVAKEGFPGVAPLRIHTFYEQYEIEQPGTPAKVHTFAYREDLRAMKRDIEKARAFADIVVLALHFGVHKVRAELAEYQQDVCYAAIDAGADVIIGTHPHVQKAIEVYKGKVIFYSIANFSFDRTPPDPIKPELAAKYKERAAFWARYKDKTKKASDDIESCIVKIIVADKKIKQVSFIPVLVNSNDQPYKPEPGSRGFDDVVKYTLDVTREVGIDTQFKIEGGEVLVVT